MFDFLFSLATRNWLQEIESMLCYPIWMRKKGCPGSEHNHKKPRKIGVSLICPLPKQLHHDSYGDLLNLWKDVHSTNTLPLVRL